MGRDDTSRARRYWDERATENALWYVDTSLDYAAPDVERFLADGEAVVAYALDQHHDLLPGHGRALEIGCGAGRICRALATRFHEVIGIDVSPRMLEHARRLVPTDEVTFLVGDGSSLAPVADDSVDLVLSYTVFQHIADPEVITGYIHEAARVLRPGGLLVAQWNGQETSGRWAVRRWVRVLRARLGLAPPAARSREATDFIGTSLPLSRMRAAITGAGLVERDSAGEGTLFSWIWAQRPAPTGDTGVAQEGDD
jgi:SAM-dependent methyltransferase